MYINEPTVELDNKASEIVGPNIARLTHLKHVLANLKLDKHTRFDMRNWIGYNECGTTACALGYAAMDPVFNEQGLILTKESDDIVISYYDYAFLGAAKAFFNLTELQAEYIFIPICFDITYNSPQAVIEHIDNVINGCI